jgi:hypothetical protein
MEFLNVLVAAIAAFAFGAVWYSTMSKPWIAAAEIQVDASGKPMNGSSPMPFVIGFVAMILVAGMMRHTIEMSGITSVMGGIMVGAGVGAFLITPWMAMNYAFAMRKSALSVIDGVNAIVGCTIMGIVLTLF